MKKILLATLALVIVLTSCKTGSQFTSRRYMKGHYASKSYHKDKIKAVDKSNEINTLIASTKKAEINKPVGNVVIESKKEEKEIAVAKGFNKKVAPKKKSSAFKAISDKLTFAPLLLTKKTQNNVVTQKTESKGESGELDILSLLAMIFGIVGMLLSYIGFMIFWGTWTYLIFFVMAIAFGVCGIIFGATGIKRYRDTGHWSSLAFGIAGLATGVLAIIFAVYYFIFNLILIMEAV